MQASKAKAGWAIAGTLALFAVLLIWGPTASDREGWVYNCPSPVHLLTASSFIEIEPIFDENSPDDGEPDGRRVYGKCKATAKRHVGAAFVVLIIGTGLAVYLALRQEEPDAAPWEDEED